jgi:hypothetical protein
VPQHVQGHQNSLSMVQRGRRRRAPCNLRFRTTDSAVLEGAVRACESVQSVRRYHKSSTASSSHRGTPRSNRPLRSQGCCRQEGTLATPPQARCLKAPPSLRLAHRVFSVVSSARRARHVPRAVRRSLPSWAVFVPCAIPEGRTPVAWRYTEALAHQQDSLVVWNGYGSLIRWN